MSRADRLSTTEEWRITQAVREGVAETRVAELFGISADEVRAVVAAYDRVRADSEAWDATLAREKKNAQK